MALKEIRWNDKDVSGSESITKEQNSEALWLAFVSHLATHKVIYVFLREKENKFQRLKPISIDQTNLKICPTQS